MPWRSVMGGHLKSPEVGSPSTLEVWAQTTPKDGGVALEPRWIVRVPDPHSVLESRSKDKI